MSTVSEWRGHRIHSDGTLWRYTDTDQLVCKNPRRSCGHCGLANTLEGHDGCLGTLPGVVNACCGHGTIGGAYIQFRDGRELRGAQALADVREPDHLKRVLGLISRP